MSLVSRTGILLATTMLLLTACETMEGLGRDTSKLGGNVTNAAEKNDGNAHDDAGGTK